MIDWMTVAFMFLVFINACMFGGVIFLVVQLARLLNPNLYRRQVISNKQKTHKEIDGGPLRIQPGEIGAKRNTTNTDGDSVLKEFVKEL